MTASMSERIAVLVSGSGTNLQALMDDPTIRPHLSLVLSDRPGIRALDRAGSAGIPTAVLEPERSPIARRSIKPSSICSRTARSTPW